MESKHSPRLTVDLLQPGEEETWDAFVAAHPSGNIYHTLAWKAVEEEGFGNRAYYLRAIGKGELVGVLPLFLVKGLYGRRLVSVPMRDRGGVLATNPSAASALLSRAKELAKVLRCNYLELRSLTALEPELIREHKLNCNQYWITTRLDLSPGTQRLWKNLDRDAIRWAIGKAARQGIRVLTDDTEKGLEQFYKLFVRTRCSMGIPPFPKSLFISIWSNLIRRGSAILFLETNGANLLHGMICLLSKDTFIPAYAAPQNQWRKLYINEVMFWHTIAWAANQGFHFYDFGADSPHQRGLLEFKEKWGGVKHPMFYYYFSESRNTLPNFDSSTPLYDLTRRVWRQLPMAVSRSLGGWITRQLS